jgi:hypothetical protein
MSTNKSRLKGTRSTDSPQARREAINAGGKAYQNTAEKQRGMASQCRVEGASLQTWLFPRAERVSVMLSTEGRPIEAEVEVWQGPDSTPHKMKIYAEDGQMHPIHILIDTPRGSNTIAVRNSGLAEFPLFAVVAEANDENSNGFMDVSDMKEEDFYAAPPGGESRLVQGGDIRTYMFEPNVEKLQVSLVSDLTPLSARLEFLQGPNNVKQVIKLYTENGSERPFRAIFTTPGFGNTVRLVNTAPLEFPFIASLQPYETSIMSDALMYR